MPELTRVVETRVAQIVQTLIFQQLVHRLVFMIRSHVRQEHTPQALTLALIVRRVNIRARLVRQVALHVVRA